MINTSNNEGNHKTSLIILAMKLFWRQDLGREIIQKNEAKIPNRQARIQYNRTAQQGYHFWFYEAR